jgi:hypothetical protein
MLIRLARAALLVCTVLLAACDPGADDDPDATLNIVVSITGLDGTLVLFNSGAGAIGVTGSGNVDVATHVLAGSPYNITVAQQPYGQACTLSNGSGIATSDGIPAIQVTCTVATYPVQVTVSGMNAAWGSELRLTKNGRTPLNITSDGIYTFDPAPLTHGDAYHVDISSEPVGHACSISGGTGIATAPITGMSVQCTPLDPMMIREVSITATGPKFLRIGWQSVPDATYYRLMRDADGIDGGPLVQVGSNTTQTTAIDRVSIHLRTAYIYVVQACDAMHCVSSVPANTDGMLKNAIGYLKADWVYPSGYFGLSNALNANGQTLATGAAGLGTYVYYRSTSFWQQQARISLTSRGNHDPMGKAVALSADGHTMAVTELNGHGAVRIYLRNYGVWTEQAVITAPSTLTYSFGQSISLSSDGNSLVVGDPGYSSGTGRAYLYERSGSVWSPSSVLHAPNQHEGGSFGRSVAIAGDGSTLVVGAAGDLGVGTGGERQSGAGRGQHHLRLRRGLGLCACIRHLGAAGLPETGGQHPLRQLRQCCGDIRKR